MHGQALPFWSKIMFSAGNLQACVCGVEEGEENLALC
jgi:hypothetical protein